MFFSFIFSIFSSEILLSVMKEFTIDIEPKLANALIPILEESATRMTSSAAFNHQIAEARIGQTHVWGYSCCGKE